MDSPAPAKTRWGTTLILGCCLCSALASVGLVVLDVPINDSGIMGMLFLTLWLIPVIVAGVLLNDGTAEADSLWQRSKYMFVLLTLTWFVARAFYGYEKTNRLIGDWLISNWEWISVIVTFGTPFLLLLQLSRKRVEKP